MKVADTSDELEFIREAIRDYHNSLDLREHGGVAASNALHKIEQILEMPWEQGAEQARRAEKIRAGK
jgi:hypothetical protein